MSLYIIALMYRATKANAVELAECFEHVHHDSFTRLLGKRCCWQKLLWQRFSQRLLKPGGWLEIDDTVLDKFGAHIFGVSWVYSARQQRVVQGINVVVLLWTDGQRRIPVGIKLWRKGGASKIILAAKLLRWAKRLGLQPDYVVMDSWYSAKRLLQQIRAYHWHFVTRLKKNRKFQTRKLSQHWPHRFGHAEGQLTGGITVLVVKDGGRYLATSQTNLSVQEVKALYAKRQQIEEFFKLMRGQLRWHQCPARSKQSQVAHLHLSMMAFLVLQEEAVRQQTSVYKLRRNLFRLEVPAQSPLLKSFISTA
ncbi:MAG: transposase [Synechococcus elongatus]|uniref:transposase n=1 Tax=Synechococcus elongatus TaxID=32046 RepID=UPI003F30A937